MFSGYAAGKTTALLIRALIDKFQIAPDGNIAIYNPTYDLNRLNIIPRLSDILDSMPVTWDHDKVANVININGYGKIIFRTLDNPSRIIAYEVFRSHVDELDTLPAHKAEEAWHKIIARNRQIVKSGADNRVCVYSTPEGFRFCHKLWVKDAKNNPDYQYITASTRGNPHLPESYIKSLEDTYPAELLAAYLEGKFVNMQSGTVYYAYNRNDYDCDVTIREKERLQIGMDFNVGKQCAVVHVIRDKIAYAVDEFVDMYDTPAAIDTIKERYPEHSITVFPDASGGARKSVDASKSDIKLLKQNGFKVLAKKKNPFVKDRILAANLAFQQEYYYINKDKCPEYADSLEQLAYDKNSMPDKESGFDHITDAGTYFVAFKYPIKTKISSMRSHTRNWK